MNNLRTKRKIEYDGFIFTREGGYYRRSSTGIDNPERWLHRFIYTKNKGIIPEGFIIHHKDENKENNDIENLELIKFEDHSRLHAKKTDNSFLKEKIELRLETINLIDSDKIKVLELFSGDNIIWSEVKKQTQKQIEVLRIDEKNDKTGIYLKGNNLKFINNIDLSIYNIIDLDAYGSPFKQLEIIFKKQFRGYIHCTFIQSLMGRLDNKLLLKLGYSEAMIKKAQTIFSKNGMDKFSKYLSLNGINLIKGFFIERKNYFYFKFGYIADNE